MIHFVFSSLYRYPFQHDAPCDQQFKVFKQYFEVSYDTEQQDQTAFENFCDNLEFINIQNSLTNTSTYLRITPHADRTFAPGNTQSVQAAEDIPQIHLQRTHKSSNTIDYYNKAIKLDNGTEIDVSFDAIKINDKCKIQSAIGFSFYDNGEVDQTDEYKMKSDAVIPDRVDLRKLGLIPKIMDQGTCGSCYAVTARAITQALLLKDTYFLRKSSNEALVEVANIINSSSLSLSLEYLMTYTSYKPGESFNVFCGGGNYNYVVQDQIDLRVPTSLVFHKDAIYTSMMLSDSDKNYDKYINQNVDKYSKLNLLTYVPIQIIDVKASGCPIIFMNIKGNMSDKQGTPMWSVEQQNIIKFYLSKGLAVSGQAKTDGGTQQDNKRYSLYSKGILDGICTVAGSNHQVTIIGYGKYRGTPVWVFANSWGASWGIQGTYYIRIGSNFLCHEALATIVFNKYHGFNSSDDNLPFEQSQLYKDNKNSIFIDIYSNTIRDGINGLDNADGTWSEQKLNPMSIIFYIIFCLYGCFLIYYLGVCVCCPPHMLIKPPIYKEIDQVEAAACEWDDLKQSAISQEKV